MSIVSMVITALIYVSFAILAVVACFVSSFLYSCIYACATFAFSGGWHVVNCLSDPYKQGEFGGFGDLGHVYHAGDDDNTVPWAIVTGSTDSIGFEIASRLFDIGWNVMIMGRNQAKIDAAVAKIKLQRGEHREERKLSSYCLDFSKATLSDYEKFSSSFSKLIGGNGRLRLLVNNAGLATEIPDFLSNIEDQVAVDIVNVNVTALMMMTKTAIPLMDGKGMIVNISSAFSLLPCCPLNSVYAATKAFVNSFTKSMQQEYAGTGIIFKLLTPHLVVSKMSKFEKPSFFVPTSKSYASHVVCSGFSQVGYFSHELLILLTSLVPSSMLSSTIMKTMLNHRSAMKLHQIKNQ